MGVRKELPNEALLGLASETLRKGHTVVIWVKGYSMRPFIEHERDRVKLALMPTLQVGDAVLAQITPGTYVLHRIIRLDGEHVTLQGDGNVRGVEHCLVSDVCGTVIEYIRPRRTIPANDPRLCRNIRWWRKMRGVRRYLLFLYRAVV
ncbi:MAG: S24/S26 family peptidase [Bacteroidaceae bacterium]|nr:S24/S26 family peptidase [Bacteroidaceae bacterium]